ncbi:hypothetical protein MSAN_02527600 [Mycena sanguinolenta]|uniref:Pali-domain-containing protein n=1 Tax=Mycena sanguinolenta TaxID=230812 RepID=A0A8H6TWH6_9AGAR|nr:hypothetical protein MSAN_02527600 [Mycena sanguinolenta]
MACLFSLLIGLSLPIIKQIYLLKVSSTSQGQPATSVATELRFGVWGVLNEPSLFSDTAECFGPMLGYTVPADIIALTGVSTSIVNAVLKSLLVILVLHVVAAVLSLVTLASSLFLASHKLSILSLVFAIITAIVSSVVFAIDVAIVVVAKQQVPTLAANGLQFAIGWGNGPWLGLVAVILTWMAVIVLSMRACYCLGVRP